MNLQSLREATRRVKEQGAQKVRPERVPFIGDEGYQDGYCWKAVIEYPSGNKVYGELCHKTRNDCQRWIDFELPMSVGQSLY